MLYSYASTSVTCFAAFWEIWLFLYQASNKKIDKIDFFPENLDVGAALIPFAILGFGGLIVATQVTIKKNLKMSYRYGYAGRALLQGFYFLSMSVILAIGNRVMDEKTFINYRLSSFLTDVVNIIPGVMYINAFVAMIFIFAGLLAFVSTFSQHEDE